ncbi:hypothetical protein [Paracoccus spongiarum]|uniref:PepSY domain-containing protein n=1 Tax=Paracoccus spongiarum TaxID=3064387 RepID=A0ABT9J7F7_9RHOB|nr:hypothetical protein [Paracoccus sp. 2205BS29-5]MDP5305738.1 hypothetical protein [Paracoccus sp. 2205BS29-5]
MQNPTLRTLIAGGRIAAVAALLGGTALAQTTETVIVPAPALEADGPASFVAETGVPMAVQLDNEQEIAETLIAQGFTDVYIKREGALMTITANRAGEPIELVYSVANGSLVSVNGEELRPDPEASSSDDTPAAAAGDDATDDDATDDDATDDGSTDDGATDDGTDDGATDDGATNDGSADDGATGGDADGDASGAGDDGSDAAAGDGSDSDGSDGDGSDGGSDGGSDSNG